MESSSVAVEFDPDPAFASYAHPERLVSNEWLSAHLGAPGLKIVESDEDVLLYDIGHIPTAQKVDWHLHLNDPVTRDYITGEQFAELMRAKGISRDDTVVIYGDKSNWWAAYALWVFTLFGHEDVRLLDGGRDAWMDEQRETSFEVPVYPRSDYPVVERDDSVIRAFADEVLADIGTRALVDVRSPQEYTGERTHMPDYPEEGALRGGHIPTAVSIPWAKARTGLAVPYPRRARRDLRRPGFGHPDDRVLPHRRALEPHVVRAHPPPRLHGRQELRRLVDRVGQHRAGPHRARRGAGQPRRLSPDHIIDAENTYSRRR